MHDFDLDRPLIGLAGTSYEWTIRNAVEGVQIFGGIGSGKSSGPGRTIARNFLKANFGGLVLTVKPDDKDDWIEYCRETGRLDDLVVIGVGGNNTFNFFQFEQETSGSALTSNLVHILSTVLKASQQRQTGGNQDAFWQNSLDMLIHNIIELAKLAYGNVTIEDIYQIAQTIPIDVDAIENERSHHTAFFSTLRKARTNLDEKLAEWRSKQSVETFERSDVADLMDAAIPERRTLGLLEEFFFERYIPMHEKTRSIIDFSLTGFLHAFMQQPIFSMFCEKPSTVTPNDCLKGKIILVDLPVKVYGKLGRDIQIMIKYVWQRAMERRRQQPNMRPVFLFADESQNFIHEHDATYQATARSSRICTVYITQNLANYYANIGAEKGEFHIKSFLGTLNTKIFMANADLETNEYASKLIGESYYWKVSEGMSKDFKGVSQSMNASIERELTVRPEQFHSLKTGGTKHNYVTEGFLHLQGTGSVANWFRMRFMQKTL